jgi:hypothetical protein
MMEPQAWVSLFVQKERLKIGMRDPLRQRFKEGCLETSAYSKQGNEWRDASQSEIFLGTSVL